MALRRALGNTCRIESGMRPHAHLNRKAVTAESGTSRPRRWPPLDGLVSALVGVAACTGVISQNGAPSSSGASSGAGSGSGTGSSGNGAESMSEGGPGSSGTTDSACTPLGTIPRRLWRLSAEQWGAAAKDLLGLQAAPVLTERGGESAYAFFSDVSNGIDSAMLFNMYQLAGQTARELHRRSSVGTTIAPCTGTTASAQAACAQTFIQGFATKAYRRPLDSDEVPNLMKVYAQGAMQSYKAGIELMIDAVLLAPSFVYRTELGPPSTPDSNGNYPNTTLTPYEVATQLSFTLLGSQPDDLLMAAAADGTLGTTAGIQQQIQRLLGLASVQANIANIMLGWFNVNQMYAKVHDTSLLAPLAMSEQNQTDIENDLETSTLDFVSSILWNGSKPQGRRPLDVPSLLCQSALGNPVSGAELQRAGADGRHHLRRGDLAGGPESRRRF